MLFFISVGLMLDPYVFVNEPWAVIAVMLIIMCITSSVTAALVLLPYTQKVSRYGRSLNGLASMRRRSGTQWSRREV